MNELKVSDKRFKSIEKQLDKMRDRAVEFCQSRSNFQISKFITCSEYTPITKFRHTANNSYLTMQEVRRMIIEKERTSRKLNALMSKYDQAIALNESPTKDDLDLDIYELTRQLEETDIRIKGLLKEVDYMERICDELENQNNGKFTERQYQSEEALYWEKRLSTQMLQSIEAARTGAGEGNIMSAWMAMENPPIKSDTQNQIAPLNIHDINEIARKALHNRNGVCEHLLGAPTEVNENEVKPHNFTLVN